LLLADEKKRKMYIFAFSMTRIETGARVDICGDGEKWAENEKMMRYY